LHADPNDTLDIAIRKLLARPALLGDVASFGPLRFSVRRVAENGSIEQVGFTILADGDNSSLKSIRT
jgi:hypothetical protein